jgi:hypothetical protein
MKKNIVITFVLILALTIFGLSFFLSGNLKPELKSLKNDPIVNMTYDNAELIRKFEKPEGKSLGKPLYATILLRYKIINQEESEQVFNNAIKNAENVGWKRDLEWKGSAFSAEFEKEMKTGKAKLLIILANDDYSDKNSKKELSVSLDHR